MKNMNRKSEGITLIALIITVVVLGILASIVTYSGIDVINSSKQTAFIAEMKIMQTQVNELYQKYKDGETIQVADETYTGEEILTMRKDSTNTSYSTEIENSSLPAYSQAEKVFTSNESGITDKTGYLYFNKKLIEDLGIEGVDQEFFVNIKTRSVISYEGLEYEDETYYTLEQLPNSLYNVEYEDNNESKQPTFTVEYEKLAEDKMRVNIKVDSYEGYINKWEVKYKLEEESFWRTSEDLTFVVTTSGKYKIKLVNGNIESEVVTKLLIGNNSSYIPTPEDSTIEELSEMTYGVIEVEFLKSTGYTTTTTPNEPILKDEMEAVYWVDNEGKINTNNSQSNTTEVKESSASYNKSNWYQYTTQTGSTDGKTSRWANAITSDGSYYVWIPRYSYRIIYFDSETHENQYRAGELTEEEALKENYIVGYSDARGIVDSKGKRPTNVSSQTAIAVNDKYFRTHPVFDGNPDEGGWDSKLEGIWVMKYEASRDDADETKVGTGTIPKSVPNVKSWVKTNVSTMFTVAKNSNTTLSSHMMKNSEWGAVAYLTESKYGRNGIEISVNQCSTQITGTGRGTGDNAIYNSEYTYSAITEEQKYTGMVGQLSSTTGNIYGIYDISGGANEYVMGFYGTDTNTPIYGNSGFTTETFPSEKKYYPIYQNLSNALNDTDGGMLGDATKETKSWNSNRANFVNSSSPVFRRGCSYKNPDVAGIFYYSSFDGVDSENVSFRVCLAVQ